MSADLWFYDGLYLFLGALFGCILWGFIMEGRD